MFSNRGLKYLTFLILAMPLVCSATAVKDILNVVNETVPSLEQDFYHAKITSYTLADFKNDGKKIVMIDAGHGGNDPGTHGPKSVEKEIALSIALKLGKKIKASNQEIIVKYTRTKDVFIPLHKRAKMANDAKADLFISIHCNYVENPKICGTETYVMGLHRAEENLNVAKRENSVVLLESDFEKNYEGYDPNSPIGHIVLSSFQNGFLEQSIALADEIEKAFVHRKKTKSRGVKQAGFAVLRKTLMPAILVETGFLSNRKEEDYLLSHDGQEEIANSIKLGIVDYFGVNVEDLNQAVATVKKEDTSTAPTSGPHYTIQIGVFSKKKDAEFHTYLEQFGELHVVPTKKAFKYLVGKYSDKSSAQSVCNSLKAEGFTDAWVKKQSQP